MKTEDVLLTQVRLNDDNPRTISGDKFRKLVNSLLVFPKMMRIRPVVVDGMMTALGGNMRVRALREIQKMNEGTITDRLLSVADFIEKTDPERRVIIDFWNAWHARPTVCIIRADELSEAERRQFVIKDNAQFGEWDYDMLADRWDGARLPDWGVDVWDATFGVPPSSSSSPDDAPDGAADLTPAAAVSLSDRFVVPPFSVLDTRQGYWQARKRKWKELIRDAGKSRNDTGFTSPEMKYPNLYHRTQQQREKLGISFSEYIDKYVPDDVMKEQEDTVTAMGVSLLDPVMAEIVCRWFGRENCRTFDPFAGDTAFGYVSARLGNEFVGIELRPEQVRINNECTEGMSARYINDDGQNVAKHIEAGSQDLLFSCPPYFDLEKYSDLPNDASNQRSYGDFIRILENAFKAAVTCLKDDRFAVIVVGDVRNKSNGCYYDFPGDVKRIFKEAGMPLYNEIILVECIGSGSLFAASNMDTRKVTKKHQNILVFYKGETKRIKDNFKKIEYEGEDLELFGLDSGDESEEDTGTV